MAGGWCLGGWWLEVWWLVAGGWWLVAGGCSPQHPLPHQSTNMAGEYQRLVPDLLSLLKILSNVETINV